jgi:hypothetical protein
VRIAVTRNPYRDVDWARDLRLKTALHDHVKSKPALLQALDDAGYHAVPIMHYSGVASKSHTWRERRWPPESVLPPEFLAGLKHIRLLFPSAEEVGHDHMTSPLLTTYIAKWEKKHYERREAWHYGSTQEAIDLIQGYGGLAFLAHPWHKPRRYTKLRRYTGMEIYNAYCRHKFQTGEHSKDRNATLVDNWDRVLHKRPSVVGIAVNDWFGPWRPPPVSGASPDAHDSGKVIVLAKAATLDAFRAALTGGAVLAVADLGAVKDKFPLVSSIRVSATAIQIDAAGGEPKAAVHWVANGKRLDRRGGHLPLAELPAGTRYVRAEIVGADGSTVYTQAFATR